MTATEPHSLGSIVFAGGGTAGHVSPLLAMAAALLQQYPATEVSVIGTDSGLETTLVPAAGLPLEKIDKVPLPRRLNLDLFKVPSRLLATIRQAEQILTRRNANVVVGVGGYVCTPVYLAARKLGIPVIIHEANKKPGLANKVGARFAAKVATAYDGTRLGSEPETVGMPLRAEIVQARRGNGTAAARERLGLDPQRKTLVVTGGSSGAVSLNEALAGGAGAILATGAQILHLTGHGKRVDEQRFPAVLHEHYQQREYLATMEDAYLAADLMVTRAGAGTVFELTAVGVPTVFVPLPVGNGEQRQNVEHLRQAGATTVLDNADFTAEWVSTQLVALLADDAQLQHQGTLMAEHGQRDAAARMVQMIQEVSR